MLITHPFQSMNETGCISSTSVGCGSIYREKKGNNYCLSFWHFFFFLPSNSKNTTRCLWFYLWIKRWRLKPELLYVSKDRTTQLLLTVNWWWISRNKSGELFLRHYISIIWWCWNTRDATVKFQTIHSQQDNIWQYLRSWRLLDIVLLSDCVKCTVLTNTVPRIWVLVSLGDSAGALQMLLGLFQQQGVSRYIR